MTRFTMPPERLAALEEYIRRVNARALADTLARVRALCLEYDWPNATEHVQWLATAGPAEIADWASQIMDDEDTAAEAHGRAPFAAKRE